MPNGEPTGAPKAGGATLEQRLSIFDSIGKSLEDLVGAVREIPKVVSKSSYYTYYTVKAALGLAAGVAIAGTPTALILPLGMAAGTLLANWKNKEKKTFKETYKQISNELCIGGILGGLLHYVFLGSNYLGNIVEPTYGTPASLAVRGGCAVAQMPPFLAANELLNRTLISDYKPKPLKDMFKQIKGPMKWLIPPLIANFTIVPPYLQMYVAAIISATYGYLKAEPKKKEEKPETYKLPQQYAMPKAA